MSRTPRPREAIEAALAASDLFGGLDPAGLRELTDAARTRALRAGELLWEMGSRPDEMAVVLEGRLDVEREGARGHRILRRLDAGSVVGISVIAQEPNTARLVAGVPTRVALLPGGLLRRG